MRVGTDHSLGIRCQRLGVSATFYDRAGFLGSIGAGPNFFFLSCPSWRGIRSASDVEIGEFKQLLGDVN